MSSDAATSNAFELTRSTSKSGSTPELSRKKSQRKNKQKHTDSSSDIQDIDDIIAKLTEEVTSLAFEMRNKLNGVDYSALIASVLREHHEVIDGFSMGKVGKKIKKLSQMNKAIESDIIAFNNFMQLLKKESSNKKKKKILAVLESMKKRLERPICTADVDLLHNEEIEWKSNDVSRDAQDDFNGKIYLSNYRLLYIGPNDEIIDSYPLAFILSVSKLSEKKQGGSKTKGIEIITKDQRVFTYGFKSGSHRRAEIVTRLKDYIEAMPYNLFCWRYDPGESQYYGWDLYDPIEEFGRLGVEKEGSNWRYSNCNNDYQLCDSYPKILVVPADTDDSLLMSVASYRSRGRIPILSWIHRNGASITRCSQPGVGMSRKRCKEDEQLIQKIYHTNKQQVENNIKFPILDARPKANAVANTAMGYGYELIQNYHNCTITFCDIGNIHVMRNSLGKIRDAIYDSDGKWLANIISSEWLSHQHMIINATMQMVDLVDKRNTSVLVHCSDGWDRTSQLVSLAQLIMDPYYRTMKGFCILLEKDWLTSGHRFSLRHTTDGTSSSDRAPIFHQFIETVWQIQHQFPLNFEFNEAFLIDLLDEVYALRFGTFLFDNERERIENELSLSTKSLWSYFLDNKSKYTHGHYVEHKGVLDLDPTDKKIKFWEGYYFRHHKHLRPTYSIYDFL